RGPPVAVGGPRILVGPLRAVDQVGKLGEVVVADARRTVGGKHLRRAAREPPGITGAGDDRGGLVATGVIEPAVTGVRGEGLSPPEVGAVGLLRPRVVVG